MMRGLLSAFATIWAVTAVGWAIGRYGLLGPRGELVLARLVFFIATPALLLDTLARADLADIVTPALATFVLSAVVAAALFLAWARVAWRRPLGDTVIGTMAASYVNAANLGLPVAAYALGDVAFAVPVLLFQILLAGPAALALLEADARAERGRPAALPLRNPIILAAAAGLVISASGWSPPAELLRPFALVGGAAVPMALLALGMSLAGRAPAPDGAVDPAGAGVRGGAGSLGARWVVVLLKLAVQPLVAYLVGRFAFGLTGVHLLAAVITAGLPTAQNVFVFASRYGRAQRLAGDAVVVSTVLAAASLILVALWLG